MNTQFDTETLKAIIQEGRRQGFPDTFIADKLNIAAEEVAAFIEGESSVPTNSRSLGSPMTGIAKGFNEWELFHLQEDDKRKLLIVMARIAEASYRRGAQQGWWMRDSGQKLKIPLDKLRFGTEPLDSARMPLCGTRMASIERLQIQHGFTLMMLGLDLYPEQ